MIIRLHLQGDETDCFIERAEARAVDWGMQVRVEHGLDRKLRFDFEPFNVQRHDSLTDPQTAAVTLHHPQRKLALSVRRDGVLFYEDAEADSVLHTVVDTQGEEEGCCWPTTSTKFRPGY